MDAIKPNSEAAVLPASRAWQRMRGIVFWPIASALVILLGVAVYYSLGWRMDHDAPAVLYFASLIDRHGFVPYRDLWEINLPGTYLIYIFIGRLIGYTDDFKLRLVDLSALSLIAGLAFIWLRRLDWRIPIFGALLFGIRVLQLGAEYVVQRDTLLLIPILAAVLLATSDGAARDRGRAVAAGLLIGLAGTSKPHAMIALLPIMGVRVLMAREAGLTRRMEMAISALLPGFAALIPVGVVVAYMFFSGGWPYYQDILLNYYPLYSKVSNSLAILSGSERLAFMAGQMAGIGGLTVWLIPALIGLVVAARSQRFASEAGFRHRIILLAGLAGVFWIYPALSGQFLPYHWNPFHLFLSLTVSLCLLAPGGDDLKPLRLLPLLALSLMFIASPDFSAQVNQWFISKTVQGLPDPPLNEGRTDAIADYLKAHLQPGDTVQPLDLIEGGVLHALLLADARLATRYPEDFLFFHDVSNPYIQRLRQDFVTSLHEAPPRFIVDFKAYQFISGPDTSSEFPELRMFIVNNYRSALKGPTYEIYEYEASPYHDTQRSLIAYTEDNPAPADWYTRIDHLTRLEATETAVLAAAGKPQVVVLGFFDPDYADPDRALERIASQKLFRIEERWSSGARLVTYYSNPAACAAAQRADAAFGESIRLNAFSVEAVRLGDHQLVCVHLEWEALAQIGESFKVGVHLTPSGDGALLAQYDSQPVGYLMPTVAWQPGQPVIDRFAIPLPAGLPAGKVEVSLFLYNEATQERLNVASQTGAAQDHLWLGEIEIK